MTTGQQLPRFPGVDVKHVFPPPPRVLRTGVPVFLGRSTTVQPTRLEPGVPVEADPDSVLPAAVRGFFANGGQLCYLVRLEQTGDLARRLDQLDAALAAVDAFDEIDLICAPDLIPVAEAPPWLYLDALAQLQGRILRHCREREDRFAILDAAASPDPALILQQRDKLAGADGGYGALYFPWLSTEDKTLMPPCGVAAGIYARCDREVGTHKAPANETVAGVVDMWINLSGGQLDELCAKGVNCVRTVPGGDIRLWGARTLSTSADWQDITARRTVLTVVRWIERFLAELVHEPNGPALWARITRELTAYLDERFTRGALRGQYAEEAFFVRCDGETNPPAGIAAGRVVTRIGLAVHRPAEFIDVRIRHDAGGVTVEAA